MHTIILRENLFAEDKLTALMVTPSESDIITTVSIIKVLNSIDVNVVDHIIVADDKYMSMADEKLIKNSI